MGNSRLEFCQYSDFGDEFVGSLSDLFLFSPRSIMLSIHLVLSQGGFSHIWVREKKIIVKPAPTDNLNYFTGLGRV